MKYISPRLREAVFPAPAVYAAPSPLVEYVPPIPVVSSVAPASSGYAAPAPAVECTCPAPAISFVAPATTVYPAPAPVVEYIGSSCCGTRSSSSCSPCYLPHRVQWRRSSLLLHQSATPRQGTPCLPHKLQSWSTSPQRQRSSSAPVSVHMECQCSTPDTMTRAGINLHKDEIPATSSQIATPTSITEHPYSHATQIHDDRPHQLQ